MFVQFCFPDLPWHFPYSQVTIFFYYFFPGAVPVTIFFYYFFLLFISRYTSSHYFFTVFLLIKYFMVSRGWLKSPFTRLYIHQEHAGRSVVKGCSIYSCISSFTSEWSTTCTHNLQCLEGMDTDGDCHAAWMESSSTQGSLHSVDTT
jgi:hypothetical protein